MRRFSTVAAVLLMLASTAAMAQVRGKARLQGTIVEQGTGKPVAGATITISLADGSTAPIVVKSNDKGRWSALGLIGGNWNVDIDAPGYQPSRKGPVAVTEVGMMPQMKIEIAKAVVEAEVPASEIKTTPGVPQEAVDAVNAGQDLMAAEKYKEAVVELEKALTFLPDHVQLKQLLSQAYYKTGDLKKAISMLEAVRAADTANTGIALLLTNLYLEDGQLEKGRELLASVPAHEIADPTVYVNIGILFMNKENPSEAVTFFGKAIDLDMTRAEGYYYRGMAHIQMKKFAEAKADFQKVVELAPESNEAKESKQFLKDLK
jgi:tetratricopeptide (TPR) repeat protein